MTRLGVGCSVVHLYQRPILGGGGPPPDVLTALLALLAANSGQHSVHHYADATDIPPFTSVDLTGQGRDHIQATNSRKPTVDPARGIIITDGDRLEMTIAGGIFSIIASVTRDAGDAAGVLFSDDGNRSICNFQEGNGTALFFSNTFVSSSAATITDPGSAVLTRGDLHAALPDDTEVLVSAQNIDHTGNTLLYMGRGSGSFFGSFRRAVILEETAFSAMDLLTARQLASQYVLAS